MDKAVVPKEANVGVSSTGILGLLSELRIAKTASIGCDDL